jgi:hypothetical protein
VARSTLERTNNSSCFVVGSRREGMMALIF